MRKLSLTRRARSREVAARRIRHVHLGVRASLTFGVVRYPCVSRAARCGLPRPQGATATSRQRLRRWRRRRIAGINARQGGPILPVSRLIYDNSMGEWNCAREVIQIEECRVLGDEQSDIIAYR